ncbi:MAG: hypothetical protein AAGF44_05610 [Pseudomonadota bacterium]
MTPEMLAPLALLSEHMLLRDLALLRDLRRELAAAEAEILALQRRAAAEIALLQAGAGPAEQQAVAKWQQEAARRLEALAKRKAAIAKEEEVAQAAALEAFGRGRAVDLLTARVELERAAWRRRRAEQDGIPV